MSETVKASSPRVDVERFARISAVLARCHERRAEVLRDAALSDATWRDVREQWRGQMSKVAVQFGAAFKAAQKELDDGVDPRIVANPAAAHVPVPAAAPVAPIGSPTSPWARQEQDQVDEPKDPLNATIGVYDMTDPILPFASSPKTGDGGALKTSQPLAGGQLAGGQSAGGQVADGPQSMDARPAAGGPEAGSTAQMSAVRLSGALPFEGLSERAQELLDHTFRSAAFTVKQLTAVAIEIAAEPQRSDEILRMYRISWEVYYRLMQEVQAWLEHDSDARDAWNHASQTYQTWRASVQQDQAQQER